MKLTTNDIRRLSALIAAPFKSRPKPPSKEAIRHAVAQFANAYRSAYGIVVTVEQRSDIVNDVLKKLG